MKKRINLLTKRQDYKKKELIFSYIRKLVLLIGVITLISFTMLYALRIKIDNGIKNLTQQKEIYLRELEGRSDQAQKISKFNIKSRRLQEIEGADVNYLPYYNLVRQLVSSLKDRESEQQIEIERFMLNNENGYQLVLSVPSYALLMRALDAIETENFQRYFDSVTVKSFTVSSQDINESYEISVLGVISDINSDVKKNESL